MWIEARVRNFLTPLHLSPPLTEIIPSDLPELIDITMQTKTRRLYSQQPHVKKSLICNASVKRCSRSNARGGRPISTRSNPP